DPSTRRWRRQIVDRFQREAEVACRLDHPGLCSVFDAGEEDGQLWIAMQLLSGVSLERLIRQSKEPSSSDSASTSVRFDGGETFRVRPTTNEKQRTDSPRAIGQSRSSHGDVILAAKFIEGAARALHAAHEAGLVHRDIKPGNIKKKKNGQAVIVDFGLAREVSRGDHPMTIPGEILGTPAYMSPEQTQGERVDQRSDVYSLSVTLFECLTLERPFGGSSSYKTMESIRVDEPPSLRTLNPAIPRDLEVICYHAMHKAADDRYATALDFAKDIERFLSNEPIQARPVTLPNRLLRWTQRNPGVAAMAVGIFLLLGVVAVLSMVKNAQLRAKTTEAQNNARESGINAALAKANAEQSRRNEAESERNLEEVRRMSDVKLVSEARLALDELWPLGSALLPRLDAYERDYGALLDRLPAHETSLATLEARALPYSAEDRKQDHGEALSKLTALESEVDKLKFELDEAESDSRFVALENEIKTLKAQVAQRQTWKFPGENARYDVWRREVLSELVAELQALTHRESGARAALATRRLLSQALVQTTVVDAKPRWHECQDRILANEKYSDLSLAPQEGLIPLGPDPESTFEEFLHWTSHAEGHPIPQRDAKGELPEMNGVTGIILVLLPGGIFTMGASRDPSDPNLDPQAQDNEAPPHKVTLSAFFLGKFEVTRGQWGRISGCPDPSRWNAGTVRNWVRQPDFSKHPVEQVSWADFNGAFHRNAVILPT
ncbi:MAG: protein kinase, partial [Planctomycetales bacterium]|nr:protein kinase [Planctomycetales bacterium]